MENFAPADLQMQSPSRWQTHCRRFLGRIGNIRIQAASLQTLSRWRSAVALTGCVAVLARDQGWIALYLGAITAHCKDGCEDGPAISTECALDPFASKVCRIPVLPDSRDVLQSRHIPPMLAVVSPCWQVGDRTRNMVSIAAWLSWHDRTQTGASIGV